MGSGKSPSNEWLTKAEVVELVGIKEDSVRGWLRLRQDIRRLESGNQFKLVNKEDVLRHTEIPEGWATAKEAGAILGRNFQTIRHWAKESDSVKSKVFSCGPEHIYELESLREYAKKKDAGNRTLISQDSVQKLKDGIRKMAAEADLTEDNIGRRRNLRLFAEAGVFPRNVRGHLAVGKLFKSCGIKADSAGKLNAVGSRITRYLGYIVYDSYLKHDLVIAIPEHDMVFNCIQFESLGKTFSRRLIGALEKHMDVQTSAATAKTHWDAFKMFFGWLVENIDNFPAVKDCLQRNMSPSLKDWQLVVSTYRLELIKDPEVNTLTKTLNENKKGLSSNFNIVMEVFTRKALLPALRPIKMPKGFDTGVLKGKKKSVAELPQTKAAVLEEARNDAMAKFGKGAFKDQENFIDTLLSENMSPALSQEDHANQYVDIIERRLELLRGCAEKEFLGWWGIYEKGQELLNNCDLDYKRDIEPLVEEYVKLNKGEKVTLGKSGGGLFALLFGEDRDTAISRYLQIVEHRWSGLVPVSTQTDWELGTLNNRFFNEYGGKETIDGYMGAHSQVYVALRTLLLIDTGVNVGVLENMPFDCLKKTDESGKYQIVLGNKKRADGDIMFDVLKENDKHLLSSAAAIKMFIQMTSRIRRIAKDGVEKVRWTTQSHMAKTHLIGGVHNYLFIERFRPREPIRVYPERNSATKFVGFLKRHEELRGVYYRQDSIRTSLLLRQSLVDKGDNSLSQALSDHRDMVETDNYTERFPMRLIWENKIRYMQKIVEAALIEDIDGGWKKLGLSEMEFKALLTEAHNTGLGVVCRKPKAGVQKGTKPGQVCTKQENCPECEMRFIPATEQNAYDMILFNRYLNEIRAEMETTRPERWAGKWLPWLAFTEVAIGRLSKSLGAAVYQAAQERASKVELDGRFSIN